MDLNVNVYHHIQVMFVNMILMNVLINPCLNNGTCYNYIGGFHCQCPTGYFGRIIKNFLIFVIFYFYRYSL